MPANMMSAPVGSSLTVSGSSIATVSAGPTPGSTPTKVPSVTPMKPHIRFIGCSAIANPASRALSASIASFSLYPCTPQEGREPARWQADVEQLHKEEINAHAERERDREVPDQAPAAEAARHAREQHRAGDDEAGPADERHVGEQPAADPEKWIFFEDFSLLGALAPA